jgi:CheY-like chemotaxis protein
MTIDSASSVLVVDDEPGIRTALRANFLRHGWQVETASGVREAIRILEDQRIRSGRDRYPHAGWNRHGCDAFGSQLSPGRPSYC